MSEEAEGGTKLNDQSAAKQAIYHALNSEHCVLEFKERDDGTMMILDVTDHFEQLEQMHANKQN